jgi:predicted RecB family nuclease
VIKSLLVAKDKNYKFNYGKILYGKHLNTYKFKLSNFFEEAERIIKEIFLLKENSPQQCLNRHCGVCGYNKRCRAELTQKDDLSLLSNMPLKRNFKV